MSRYPSPPLTWPTFSPNCSCLEAKIKNQVTNVVNKKLKATDYLSTSYPKYHCTKNLFMPSYILNFTWTGLPKVPGLLWYFMMYFEYFDYPMYLKCREYLDYPIYMVALITWSTSSPRAPPTSCTLANPLLPAPSTERYTSDNTWCWCTKMREQF